MAGRALQPGETGWIPVNEVRQNPFGAQSTPETLQADLDKIGMLEHWITKHGQMFDHDVSVMERVSRLLTEGVKQWIGKPTMEAVYRRWVGATPATWWILMNAENNTDKKLYYKLATCAQDFHPYVWTLKTTRAWAVAFLRAVRAEMQEEGMQLLTEQFGAYDAYDSGAGRIDG
jgi:hypothetical protein